MCTENKSDWVSGEAADFYIKLLWSESQFHNAYTNLKLLNAVTNSSSSRNGHLSLPVILLLVRDKQGFWKAHKQELFSELFSEWGPE
jgi:hypothetical protein